MGKENQNESRKESRKENQQSRFYNIFVIKI